MQNVDWHGSHPCLSRPGPTKQCRPNTCIRGFLPLPQICRQYEKPLVLQLCRLVRGFTHPASYFAGDGNLSSSANDRGDGDGDGDGGGDNREDLALFSVDEFSAEMVIGVLRVLLVYFRMQTCNFVRAAAFLPATRI